MVKKPAQPNSNTTPSPSRATADQLAHRVVHELNNLIDGCMRNMSLAISQLRHTETTADARQDAVAIERLETASIAMREMAALTRRWSRMAAGSTEHEPILASESAIDGIAVVVAQAVRLLRPVAASVGVTLDASVADELAVVPAGPVFPILLNAIRNSIDAIAAKQQSDRLIDGAGRVFITARQQGDDLLLTVTDNGPGVAPQLVDDDGAFRFGRTTKPGGHGLGLKLCREMIEDCGGSLDLRNRPEGGAALICCCPVERLRKRS
jgi:C4-dicarboxylate-specific signal transduction histidine kinase